MRAMRTLPDNRHELCRYAIAVKYCYANGVKDSLLKGGQTCQIGTSLTDDLGLLHPQMRSRRVS